MILGRDFLSFSELWDKQGKLGMPETKIIGVEKPQSNKATDLFPFSESECYFDNSKENKMGKNVKLRPCLVELKVVSSTCLTERTVFPHRLC